MRFTRYKAITPVTLIDFRGNIFYKGKTGAVFNCPNLPNITILGRTEELKPKILAPPNLQFFKPEKKIPFKGISRIYFKKNPNKCSINVSTGVVIFDKDFFNQLNIVQIYFILCHEVGHYLYYTEHKCDAFATATMLLLGFTPMMIQSAISSTLIDSFRISHNKDFLKKQK